MVGAVEVLDDRERREETLRKEWTQSRSFFRIIPSRLLSLQLDEDESL